MSSNANEIKRPRVNTWPYWTGVVLVLFVLIPILLADKKNSNVEAIPKVTKNNDCLRDQKDPSLGNMSDVLGENQYNSELNHASSIQSRHSAEWFRIEGVVGHGIGACGRELCILVHVSDENYCDARNLIPREIEGVQIRLFKGERAYFLLR